MKPTAFCTLCTFPRVNELIGLLYSLSIHHSGARIYIAADEATCSAVSGLSVPPRLQITWLLSLDRFSGMNTDKIRRAWRELMAAKADVLRLALRYSDDALLLEADVFVTGPFDVPRSTAKILGVSPSFLGPAGSRQFGRYSGGVLWVRNGGLDADGKPLDVPDLWRRYTKTSRFFDQTAVEDLVLHVGADRTHVFGAEVNLQASRWETGGFQHVRRLLSADREAGRLMYGDCQLCCVHAHFSQAEHAASNAVIIDLMETARMARHLVLIDRMIRGHWLVSIPAHPVTPLRELVRLWAVHPRTDPVVAQEIGDSVHCWLGGRRRVLLAESRTHDAESLTRPFVVISREATQEHGSAASFSWSSWPRKPGAFGAFLAEAAELVDLSRAIACVGILRSEHVANDELAPFAAVVDDWVGPDVYAGHGLHRLMTARFALCGSLDYVVELMGMGTVPLLVASETPRVEWLGSHRIQIIKSPGGLRRFLEDASDEQWGRASRACRQFYNDHLDQEATLRRALELAIYGNSLMGNRITPGAAREQQPIAEHAHSRRDPLFHLRCRHAPELGADEGGRGSGGVQEDAL
jgi:hypothetical protein